VATGPTQRSTPSSPSRVRWTCPKCKRAFTRVSQRHACGASDGTNVLRGRPEAVVRTYAAVEAFVRSLGPIELVTRERYVLFRSVRIFADLVIMAGAVRVAIHLPRRVEDPRFIKVVEDRKKVTHVVKLTAANEVEGIKGYLREAYQTSLT
jgi:predicted transport protein